MTYDNKIILSDKKLEPNYDSMFADFEILRLLSKTNKFQKWLSTYHNIYDHEKLFKGYKYMITIIFMDLFDRIMSNDPFLLNDDEKIIRARHLGIKIENIPNSCEKVIILKNIWKQIKNIENIKTFDEFKNNSPLSNILSAYKNIRHDNLMPTKNITKEKSIAAITQFHIYMYLVNINSGIPQIIKGLIDMDIMKEVNYLDHAFDGYRYTLEFLWFSLLDLAKFQQTCVKNIHRSDKIDFSDKIKNKKLNSGNHLYSKHKKSEMYNERIYNKWKTIDQFFTLIRSELIIPIELEIGPMTNFENGFLKMNNFDKKLFQNNFTENVDDAPYMIKNDNMSLMERLDSELLWYPVSVLNSSLTYVFNGAFSFISMLRGLIDTMQEHGITDKITVQIFKHQAYNDNSKHDYSFGILIRAGNGLADESGWLIFYNCATDYSGSGKTYHDMCMNDINKHIFNKK